ncbi:MaoC family dehydratase [Rhodoferax sp. GW822-FHT02A01]|uniref:MaoC family dehydratase n=1 Tax=Rhodoferax sp. GW822-FHT02A01 TaxID=3141537 RepID=UPI00315CDA8C
MTEIPHSLVMVGEKFSTRHTFNEEQVRAFAVQAGDTNPLHHDSAVAAKSRYKQLIVSGTHTTALILGLTASHFSKNHSVIGISFSVEFRKAVFADAAVRIEWEVVATSKTGNNAQRVKLLGGMYDADGNLCVQATGTVRVSLSI